MNVNELMQTAPEITRKRADKICQEGRVVKMSYAKGTLRTTISDGQEYTQKVRIHDGEVLSYACSCNAEGVFCHHVLAALMKRKESQKKTLPQEPAPEKTPKATLRHTQSSLRRILENAEKEELIEFILSLRSYYKDMPTIIRKSFLHTTDEEYLKEQREELYSTYRTLKSTSSPEVFGRYFDLLTKTHEEAKKNLKERNYTRSAMTYLMLYEMAILTTHGVEHYLYNSHYVRIYQEALLTLSEKKYTLKESEGIFAYLRSICAEVADTSHIVTLLRIMKSFITTEKDYDNYYAILLMVFEKDTLIPYDRNNLLFLEYELLMMIGKADEAKELRRENPYVPEFRFMEAASLMKRGKLQEALVIVKDGIERSGRNWDELIHWLYMEADIHKLVLNQERFVEVSEELIALGEYKAFLNLKRSISPNEWPRIYEKVIENEEIQRNLKGVYKRILLEEKDKRRLLHFLEDNPELITEYYDFLNPEYTLEASRLLAEYIESACGQPTGKRDYDTIAQLIEKLYIYGQTLLANDTIMNLVMRNKSKKALHTELFRIKDQYTGGVSYRPE